MTCSDLPAALIHNEEPALCALSTTTLVRTISDAPAGWARTGSDCPSPTSASGWARTGSSSCVTPAEDIAPTCWARTGSSCAGPTPDAGDEVSLAADAPAVCKKRSRSELLADENIANELGVGGEENNLSTTEEEDEAHNKLSPRCLFPELPDQNLEEGELPHPDAIYDTTDLVGRHRNSVFTHEEADNNPSQIY